MLEGMPEPAELRLLTDKEYVLVTCGAVLVYRYQVGDTGLRNLAIVALTDAGRRVNEVARLFGLTATYVSMLRGRARWMPSRSPSARSSAAIDARSSWLASDCSKPPTGQRSCLWEGPLPALV